MRRGARVEVDLPGTLTTSDGREIPVRIRDISTDGFRIEVSDDLLPNDRVRLRGGRAVAVSAEIRWALGNEAGGVFLEPPQL